MQISGRSAIVVGGTGGFGEATVRRLHGAGAKMFLTPAYPMPAEQLEPAEYAAMVASIVDNDHLNGEVIRLDGALRFPPK